MPQSARSSALNMDWNYLNMVISSYDVCFKDDPQKIAPNTHVSLTHAYDLGIFPKHSNERIFRVPKASKKCLVKPSLGDTSSGCVSLAKAAEKRGAITPEVTQFSLLSDRKTLGGLTAC